VRRVVIFCAVAVTIFAAARMATRHPAVARAASPANLILIVVEQGETGCPLGSSFNFCDQVPGTQGPASQFVVEAVGGATNVTVAPLAAIPGFEANFAVGDFTITSNGCAGNLAATQECGIQIAFSPTTTGLRQAALTVTDDAGDKLVVNIQGTGKNLTVAPPAAPAFLPLPTINGPAGNAFGLATTPVGGTSAASTFNLAAGGTGATGITVTFAAIPGLQSVFSASDYTIESTNCTGALGPSGTCFASVSFTPQTAGYRAAALTVTDSNSDSSTIYVSGDTSFAFLLLPSPPSSQTPCARQNWFSYCNEPSGGASAGNTFTIFNASGTQMTGLTITPPMQTNPPTLPPTDFTVQGTTCTATLAANTSCRVTVIFTPQGTGVRQGLIGVSDSQGDIGGFTLSGYGDDYQLQLASGQQQQLNVAQGDGVTYKAQVMPDNVFGANGEQVTLACPTNLPEFSTCAFSNCPLAITPGMTTSFSIMIVTSSKIKQAPPVTSACSETEGAATPPSSGPQMTIRLAPEPAARRWLFPALSLLAAAMAMALAAFSRKGSRARLIFAGVGIAAMIFAGCGGGGNSNIGVTPVAITDMTINGNAVDASGNALNAGRPLSITLDVVKGP